MISLLPLFLLLGIYEVVGQEEEIIFDYSTYAVFTKEPLSRKIAWTTAQSNCMNWGGNLVTIDSKQIDSLLYHMTSSYTCWIGLNDRDNEAGNNGSAFVWVDGSNSTYRQWDTINNNEPDGANNAEYNCVSFRYRDGAASGWDDRTCDAYVYCYFCQKSGDSRGCDLIYNGSCYRAFEVSDGINWLDAQSSCAVWGGDLTSITTERESNLLYTAISDTVNNYWIGLYERDGDGVYQWVDGTALSFTNWTGSAPTAGSTTDCAQMNTNITGDWIATDCKSASNSFICKRPSINTNTTGFVFGELIDDGVIFKLLQPNTFLYNSTILVCKGDVNSAAIAWQYSVNADLSSSEVLEATYMSTQTGVSWLSVDNTKQGYYQCYIDSTNSYTVGVFDTQKTTVASGGILYHYVVGIDREDVMLLCDPMDSMYDLNSLSWRVNGDIFSNPFNVFSARNSFSIFSIEIDCLSNSVTVLTSIIRNYVPEITVTYNSSNTMRFITVFPGMNRIALEVGSKDFSITGNTSGRWKLQNGTYAFSSTVSYPTFIPDYFGLYQFYVNNWDDSEVCVIQIVIFPAGYSTTNSISLSNSETIQNGSTIVITDNSSMINCIISNPDYSIEWFYKSQLGAVQTDVTSSSTFSARTGISTLNVYSNEPGYYSCVINTDIVYSFFVADRDSLIEFQTLASPSQQVVYIVGTTSSLLYYSDANIPDSSLRWTTDTVINGADIQYSIEYANPVLLSTVFSDVGAGVQTLSCFYRMSPVTLVGSLQLVIRDTAVITISYTGHHNIFSDVNNQMFPSPQQIPIQEGTRDVLLTCNLPRCMWLVQLKNSTYTIMRSPYSIPIFGLESEGNYSLIRETDAGKNYTTAYVYIHMPFNVTKPPSSIPPLPIVIIVLVIIILAMTSIVIILMFFIIYRKKKHFPFAHNTSKSPRNQLSLETKVQRKSSSAILTQQNFKGSEVYINTSISMQSQNHEALDQLVNNNAMEDMTINETSFEIMNDSSTDIESRGENYEQAKENRKCFEMNQTEPYEEEQKFVPKFITIMDFPAIYQQYVASGMGDESLFSVEFHALNEESKKYIERSDVARKEPNMRTNPYLDCIYINPSYISEYQFIASIHPTGDTLQDFLQMIYQTEASMVIMLTTRKENAKIIGGVSNRVCYWPEKDETLKCEPFITSLISSTETTAFVKQEISLKNALEGKDHSFTHCISPIWNEDGTVVELNSAITLLIRVIKQKRDYPLNPIIIHCEDGISKTGIFMTVFNVIKELNLRKSVNIFNAVKNMRKQRMNMVPTMACYTTCFSLMNEYCSNHL